MNRKVRVARLYKNYFMDFYSNQNNKVKAKIDWTIKLIENHKVIPKEYFKKMTNSDGIWEIRVSLGSDIFRIFSFFDEGNLIILENGFQKKSQKTPKEEIRRAERIKKEYYADKASEY